MCVFGSCVRRGRRVFRVWSVWSFCGRGRSGCAGACMGKRAGVLCCCIDLCQVSVSMCVRASRFRGGVEQWEGRRRVKGVRVYRQGKVRGGDKRLGEGNTHVLWSAPQCPGKSTRQRQCKTEQKGVNRQTDRQCGERRKTEEEEAGWPCVSARYVAAVFGRWGWNSGAALLPCKHQVRCSTVQYSTLQLLVPVYICTRAL